MYVYLFVAAVSEACLRRVVLTGQGTISPTSHETLKERACPVVIQKERACRGSMDQTM